MKKGRPAANDFSRKSNEELIELYLKEAAQGKKIEQTLRMAKEADPFWFYEPTDGSISDAGLELMREYLREEDIPWGKLDCQLDVHLCDSDIILDAGGNQSGKTTAGVIEAYIWATGEVPSELKGIYPKGKIPTEFPQHIRVVGVDHKTLLGNLIPAYQYWAPRKFLKKGKWSDSYSSEQRVLYLWEDGKLKGTIEFMTNQQDVESFQGPPRDGVIYDEEPRQEIYKENLMRFTTSKRLKILFCMTPTNGMTWVKYEILDKSESSNNIKCFKVPTITNPKANIPVLKEILNGMEVYEEIKMRVLGEFVSLSGLVYGNLFNSKIHVIEPFYEFLESGDKRKYITFTGWDLHLVTPMAGVFLLYDKEGNAYVDRCYFRSVDTEDLKKDFWDIVNTNGYRLGWSVVDKSSNSSIVAFGGRNIYLEVARGENAIPRLMVSQKFEGSIKAGIDEIKKKLKINAERPVPSLFIVNRPENRMLISDFKSMERDTFANEDVKGPKDRILEGKHHRHAALRYIFQYPLKWCPDVIETYVPKLVPKDITEVAFLERERIWDEINMVNENWP